MNIKNLISKSKRNHIYYIITFMILILIAVLLIIYTKMPYTILSMLVLSILLGFIALIYFIKRIINHKSLIKYLGIDNLENIQIIEKCSDNFIYQSPNNAYCDHIYINKEFIFIINNELLIIPIKEINKIVINQGKKVINPKTFNISKWQNTFLLTFNRGLPDTIYCVYEIKFYINNKCVESTLIKEVGEELLNIFNNINIKYELITINNFNDNIDRKKVMKKFKKDIIPGIIYLVVMLIIMFIFYIIYIR